MLPELKQQQSQLRPYIVFSEKGYQGELACTIIVQVQLLHIRLLIHQMPACLQCQSQEKQGFDQYWGVANGVDDVENGVNYVEVLDKEPADAILDVITEDVVDGHAGSSDDIVVMAIPHQLDEDVDLVQAGSLEIRIWASFHQVAYEVDQTRH